MGREYGAVGKGDRRLNTSKTTGVDLYHTVEGVRLRFVVLGPTDLYRPDHLARVSVCSGHRASLAGTDFQCVGSPAPWTVTRIVVCRKS
jgi:hypothetical protein